MDTQVIDYLAGLKIKRLYPDAANLRYAGCCDYCGNHRLYSFQRPANFRLTPGKFETCHFLCTRCGYRSVGFRPVASADGSLPDAIDKSPA